MKRLKSRAFRCFSPQQRLQVQPMHADKRAHGCVALSLLLRLNCPFEIKSDQNELE